MNKRFWQGKKVFITGHTGFKGSWLCEMLAGMGAIVTGYALPPATTPALFDLLNLPQKITHITGDVRDKKALAAAVSVAMPDIVLHLAAQALVRDSYTAPADTFDININGTIHLLETLRSLDSVKACVVVTSDKCYRNDDTGRAFVETDPLGGKDPYSASKAAAEIVASSYYDSFFKDKMPLATARAGNVIGGGDWAKDRLIPDVARAHAAGWPVHIRSPHSTRPWQHVLEPLSGYLLLAEKLYTDGHKFAGGWNFGPDQNGINTVGAVLEMLQQSLPFELVLDQGQHPFESKLLSLDISKTRKYLGWEPRLDLEAAIALTGNWYKKLAAGADARTLVTADIASYTTPDISAAA